MTGETPTNPTERSVAEIVTAAQERAAEWQAAGAPGDYHDHIVDAVQEELSGIDTVDDHAALYAHVIDEAQA